MTKLTSKNAVKVSVNQKAKTIKFTTQYFKNIKEGEMTLGKAKNFVILNKNRLDKMIEEGYTVVDAPVTEAPKSSWTPQYLVGGEIEEQIRKYTESKMRKQAVRFVEGITEFNEKFKTKAVEIFGETQFEKQKPIDMNKAYQRFERSALGKQLQGNGEC